MFSVAPGKVARFLIFVVTGLTLANIAVQVCRHLLGRGRLLGLVPLFDTNAEGNIPTWYSSSALLFCSILLVLISFIKKQANDRFVLHWGTLSAIFLYLSCDEAVRLHERTIGPIRSTLNTGGILHYAWVIPGIMFVLFVLLVYLKFLAALPAETKRRFLLAGTLYVSGAIGMELIGGYYMYSRGQESFTYAMITTVEECLEMLGIVSFIYALLSYIKPQIKSIHVEESPSNLRVEEHGQDHEPGMIR